MKEIYAIVGAYAAGVWVAAAIVAARWFVNQTTTITGFLTIAGWAAVATVCSAIVTAAA
jgi:hypothetical protein